MAACPGSPTWALIISRGGFSAFLYGMSISITLARTCGGDSRARRTRAWGSFPIVPWARSGARSSMVILLNMRIRVPVAGDGIYVQIDYVPRSPQIRFVGNATADDQAFPLGNSNHFPR